MIYPRPIHSRNDLLSIVRDYVPTRACGRAIDEDRATVLGGFTPPEGLSHFIVQVDGRLGQQWLIALGIDEENTRFRVWYPESVDWKHWDGRTGGSGLKDGDLA